MCQAWWAASPESSIPAPPLLPLRGRRAPHLLRFRSRDDQVFMPSMLCCPRQATRTRGTLEGASRHSRQRGRGDRGAAGLPSHHALLLPLPPGAGNTGAKRGRGGHGTAGEPGSGVPGVLREVRSSCGRPPSCALCALPAAPPPASCKDSGEVLGAWEAGAASHAAPRSAPRPFARALAGGFTHRQPWLRSRLAATILFPSRSAGPRTSSPPPPARAAPPPSSSSPLPRAPPAARAAPAPLHLITRLSRLLSCS